MAEAEDPDVRVLPARAGMSPGQFVERPTVWGAPRTGGDEPAIAGSRGEAEACSPHGRG